MANDLEKNQSEITIKHLSDIADVDVETVLYYQRMGLIDKPMTGYRKYYYITTKYIKFIKHAQKLGFSIKEIKGFLIYLK